MRFIGAIGLAVLAVGCTPKLEFVDGNTSTRPTATHLAEADEMEAAAVAQAAKPAIRNARSLPLRAQAVSAHDESKVDAQSDPAVAAVGRQPSFVTSAATVASLGAMPRDGEVATQAARVDVADRVPGQALDPAQEIALSPAPETAPIPTREISPSPARETAPSAARETALSTAQETVPSPVREAALSPAREKVLTPVRETASNEGYVQASACIRNNMKAAYRSSDTVDQATAFLMRTCFAPFSSAIASDEASAKTLFRSLVLQEINPLEWLEALKGGVAQSR